MRGNGYRGEWRNPRFQLVRRHPHGRTNRQLGKLRWILTRRVSEGVLVKMGNVDLDRACLLDDGERMSAH
jgi:hypothetical protein